MRMRVSAPGTIKFTSKAGVARTRPAMRGAKVMHPRGGDNGSDAVSHHYRALRHESVGLLQMVKKRIEISHLPHESRAVIARLPNVDRGIRHRETGDHRVPAVGLFVSPMQQHHCFRRALHIPRFVVEGQTVIGRELGSGAHEDDLEFKLAAK